MTDLVEVIREHRFFAGLPDDVVRAIAEHATAAHFDEGQMLLRENDPANEFFAVRTGRVTVEVDTHRGPVAIDTVHDGEVVGMSWLLPPYTTTFNARAVDDTEAIEFDAARLRERCDAEPALGYELYKRFAGLTRDRLQSARLRLIDLHGGSPEGAGS